MRRISEQAIVKMRGNYQVLGRLMILFDVHQKTIETWIQKKDVRLTISESVKIIKEQTKLSEDQILAN
jgi:hypothetical protein